MKGRHGERVGEQGTGQCQGVGCWALRRVEDRGICQLQVLPGAVLNDVIGVVGQTCTAQEHSICKTLHVSDVP